MSELLLTTIRGLERAAAREAEALGLRVRDVVEPSLVVAVGRRDLALEMGTVDAVSELLCSYRLEELEMRALRYALREAFRRHASEFRGVEEVAVRACVRGRCMSRRAVELVASREAKRVLSVATSPKAREVVRVYLDCGNRRLFVARQVNEVPLHLRGYYVSKHPSPLNPLIAASIPFVLRKRLGTVYDPYCGSGTIPIEISLRAEEVETLGSDVEPRFVSGARQNSERAGVDLEVFVADVRRPPALGGIDLIATDPPRGKRMGRGFRYAYISAVFALASRSSASLCLATPYRAAALAISREYGYVLSEEVATFQGGTRLYLLFFERE